MNHTNIEALESRIAPAALSIFVDAATLKVSVSGDILKITPAAGVTEVDLGIEQLPDGSILITDAIGDDDLEETADFSSALKGISVSLGAGDDHVHIALDPAYTLGGGLTISTGAGEDSVAIASGSIRGKVTISAKGEAGIEIGGTSDPVNIRGGLVASSNGGMFHFGESATAGSVSASGANDFVLEGNVAGQALLAGKALGASFLVTGGTSIGGNLIIKGTAEADDLTLDEVHVRGNFLGSLGEGDNLTTVSESAVISGIARIIGGTGDDTVSIGNAVGGGPSIHGKTTVSLGTGTNRLDAASGVISGGLAYVGGNDGDTVNLGSGLTVYGNATINARNGANTVSIESFSQMTKFSYLGGTGVDTLTLHTAGAGYVTGTLNLLDGDDIASFIGTGDFFAAFKADGGAGSDTLAVDPVVVANGLLGKNFEPTT